MKTTTLQNSNSGTTPNTGSNSGATPPHTRLSPAKAGKMLSAMIVLAVLGSVAYGALNGTDYLGSLQTHQPTQVAYASNLNFWTMMASQGK
ncbi:hypothetical protein SAMN04515620_10459 [Collimonas sp. OK607]|uniref:hypothetical protein n=1 Tax=Collimonas sp. OK607 TaxID=1798194 RepID=UPI0008ECA521|nr:hypothetical protein [Collimonas sp. OK607]SFA82630.1 hypothetical protein SAMN04515620_10459 [Collimonas sp. OK607]